MNDSISDMSAAAFDNFEDFDGENFDPNSNSNNYDPNADNYSGKGLKVIGRKPQVKKQPQATFNIKIDGTGNVASHVFELFNNEFGITKFANNQTNPGLVTLGAAQFLPLMDGGGNSVDVRAYGAISVDAAAPINNRDTVYWRDNGDLVYNYSQGSADNVIISCQEVPYRALFDYTGSGALAIGKMRLQYSQAGQIQQDFTLTYRNILGTTKNISVSPKQFFTPNQFQSLLLDCPTPYIITKERGLQCTLQPNTSLSITFFVDRYTEPNPDI